MGTKTATTNGTLMGMRKGLRETNGTQAAAFSDQQQESNDNAESGNDEEDVVAPPQPPNGNSHIAAPLMYESDIEEKSEYVPDAPAAPDSIDGHVSPGQNLVPIKNTPQ